VQAQGFAHFGTDGAQWIERSERILHDKADPPAAQPAPRRLAQMADVLPVEPQAAGAHLRARAGQADDRARRHAFARTGFTDQRHAFPRWMTREMALTRGGPLSANRTVRFSISTKGFVSKDSVITGAPRPGE
jgi:hypothetical protein